ncbi:GntR family transcriptional regulator, partial [marine sediment metagenome]
MSRQPVRDAFYRLSQLGFIQIRPQRATTVTPISTEAVMQAYFIRSALEQATMRVAALTLQPSDWDGLERLIDLQEAASREDRRSDFHALDDQFHRDICAAAGKEFVWNLVRDNKGHMDRARFLSL